MLEMWSIRCVEVCSLLLYSRLWPELELELKLELVQRSKSKTEREQEGGQQMNEASH